MDKSKLSKIIITAVLGIAMILAIVAVFSAIGIMNAENFDNLDLLSAGSEGAVKASMWTYLGITLGLAGCVAALVISILEKDSLVPFILMGAGVVAIICFFIAMGMNSDYVSALETAKKAAKGTGIGEKITSSEYSREAFLMPIMNILIFGATPIVFGLKKMFAR